MPVETKFCRLCGEHKPRTDFHRKKHYQNSYCKPCSNAKTAKWRSENPDKLKEYNKNWRPSHLRNEYGLTEADFAAMVAAHKGLCAICGGAPNGRWKALHIDHCHETGRVRGLLCGSCNRGIGMFRDSTELLERAISYLGNDK